MEPQDIPAFVERMAAAWNARDLEGYLSLLTEDVVWDDPAMQAPAVGRDAVKSFSETVLRAFPDFHYTIRQPLCIAPNGSRCAVPWKITGTHLEPMEPPGFAPTGRRVEFEGVDMLEFRGGRVSRIDTQFKPIAAGGATARPCGSSPHQAAGASEFSSGCSRLVLRGCGVNRSRPQYAASRSSSSQRGSERSRSKIGSALSSNALPSRSSTAVNSASNVSSTHPSSANLSAAW